MSPNYNPLICREAGKRTISCCKTHQLCPEGQLTIFPMVVRMLLWPCGHPTVPLHRTAVLSNIPGDVQPGNVEVRYVQCRLKSLVGCVCIVRMWVVCVLCCWAALRDFFSALWPALPCLALAHVWLSLALCLCAALFYLGKPPRHTTTLSK